MRDKSAPTLHPFPTPAAEKFTGEVDFFQSKHSDKNAGNVNVSVSHMLLYTLCQERFQPHLYYST